MCLLFIRMPGETYRRRLQSLLCLCDVFRALINSLVCFLAPWTINVVDIFGQFLDLAGRLFTLQRAC